MNIKLKLLTISALLFAAAQANAASVWNSGLSKGDMTVHQAAFTSGTIPATAGDVEVDAKKGITVWLKASTTVTATVSKLVSGTVLDSENITVGTTMVSRSYPAPQFFRNVRVSNTNPAVLTGTNSMSATIIQTR